MIRLTRSSLTASARPALASVFIATFFAFPGTTALAMEDADSASCDCSCDHYFQLVDQTLPQSPAGSPINEEERWSCAAACAIAWVRCEEQSLIAEKDPTTDEDGLQQSLSIQASAPTELD